MISGTNGGIQATVGESWWKTDIFAKFGRSWDRKHMAHVFFARALRSFQA